MKYHDTGEQAALFWLLALDRLDWKTCSRRQCNEQVLIRLIPGKLHECSGAPMVEVLVSHPAVPGKRFKGTGNSLYEAVDQVHRELWRAGVRDLPFLSDFYRLVREEESKL